MGGSYYMGNQEIVWEVVMLDPSGSRYGRLAVCCEQGNELTGFVKCPEFLD